MPYSRFGELYGRRFGSRFGTILSSTGVAVPDAPTITAPAANALISDDTPTITADPVAGADTYEVRASNVSDFSVLISLTGATGLLTPSYTVSPALTTLGNTYFQMRAVNAGGNSDWSASVLVVVSPEIIANIAFYWDAVRGVYSDTGLTTPAADGEGAKGWDDPTVNNRNATQATNPPTYQTDDAILGSALAFDGTNDELTYTTPGANVLDMDVFLVVVLNSVTNCHLLGKGGQNNPSLFVLDANTLQAGFSGAILVNFTGMTWAVDTEYLINLKRSGTAVTCSVNGTALTPSGTVALTSFFGDLNRIGKRNAAFGNFRLGRAIMYLRSLTAGERARVLNFLA